MKSYVFCFLMMSAALVGSVTAQSQKLTDLKDFKDPAYFTRMPDYYLPYSSSLKESKFDAYDFHVRPGTKDATQKIEGHKVIYCYYFDKSTGKPVASGLQVKRNYQNAVTKLGGKIVYDDASRNLTTLLISKDGKEIWAEISSPVAQAPSYYLTVVERQAMQQDVTANADALRDGLAQNGHVEVAGIYFDFNKANLKPESQQALGEVVKLLKASPALRVWVVGHTDNVGSVESNVALSKARAASVIAALTAAGIAPTRLSPFGNGPYAPVAANLTEDGRAKNRRVELVAQP